MTIRTKPEVVKKIIEYEGKLKMWYEAPPSLNRTMEILSIINTLKELSWVIKKKSVFDNNE